MLLFILQLANRSIFILHLRSHLLRSTTTSTAAGSSLAIFLSTRGITSAVKSERLIFSQLSISAAPESDRVNPHSTLLVVSFHRFADFPDHVNLR
ncbi:hypothetical protein LINPERHAP2_LOCUS38369 [Linum perenne]